MRVNIYTAVYIIADVAFLSSRNCELSCFNPCRLFLPLHFHQWWSAPLRLIPRSV